MAFTNFGVTDQGAAQSWNTRVEALNQQTNQLLIDVGNALVEVNEGADSKLVDKIVQYGNQIIEGAGKILEDMNGLVGTITSLLHLANQVVDEAENLFKGAINAIGGALFK